MGRTQGDSGSSEDRGRKEGSEREDPIRQEATVEGSVSYLF